MYLIIYYNAGSFEQSCCQHEALNTTIDY